MYTKIICKTHQIFIRPLSLLSLTLILLLLIHLRLCMKKDFSKVSSHRAGSPPEQMCVLPLLVSCIGEIFVDEALIKQFSIFFCREESKNFANRFRIEIIIGMCWARFVDRLRIRALLSSTPKCAGRDNKDDDASESLEKSSQSLFAPFVL